MRSLGIPKKILTSCPVLGGAVVSISSRLVDDSGEVCRYNVIRVTFFGNKFENRLDVIRVHWRSP